MLTQLGTTGFTGDSPQITIIAFVTIEIIEISNASGL